MKKSLVLLFCFLFVFSASALFAQSPLKVTFIDVGHGDCILIQTPDDGIKNGKYEGKIILIDGGDPAEGKRVIIPYLKSHGIDKKKPIDFLILTHAHSDHIGGLVPVIKAYRVSVILEPGYGAKTRQYRTFCKLSKRERDCVFYSPLAGTLIKKEGDNIDWGSEFEVKVLNSEQEADDPNNTSIVIWFKYNEVSFILTGDAEGKERNDPPDALKFVERDLVQE